MQGVGPGTLFGGRYDLRARLSPGGVLERWSAHDTTLEREVALTIVSSEHPNRAGVLDAARRAAGVEDTRLVRILDVGTQNDNSFIVEEALSESQSLATILLSGPLPAEEARRVAGESAKGLEAAGQRGLHHLRLTPHHVLIAPDGGIRVSGVAVAAAIDGPDDQESDSASAARRDAVCLVAVMYAGLTTRWPLDNGHSDARPEGALEMAPRGADGAVPPSEIASGVPGDLDSLCRTTLNEATGPSSPGEFASRIAPWPRDPVRRAFVEPTVALRLPDSTDLPERVPADADGSEPTVALSPQDVLNHDPGRQPESAAGGATTKALGAALAGAGTAAGAVGSKLGSLARSAGDGSAQGNVEQRTERMRLPVGLPHRGHDSRGSNGSSQDSGSSDGEGPPPVERSTLPASTPKPPSRGQALIVMLVIGAFLAVVLFVAFKGLVGPGTDVTASSPTPKTSARVKAPPAPAPATPAPLAAATAAGPIAILSATGFDPEGDESEGNSKAARVYDGDVNTSWTSEGYATADFGSLKKGVGVLVNLGQSTSVRQVTLDLGSDPADITVYASADRSLDGATRIGSSTGASGQVKIEAAEKMPKAQYVIVWFTTLAPDGGQYRASVAEIALS